MTGPGAFLAFAVAARLAIPDASGADRHELAVYSAAGDASIVLSCEPAKTIDVLVSGHHKPPVIQAPDYRAGAGSRNAVQYTVDGQGPFLEEWLSKDQGVTPQDRGQLGSFLLRLASGHIMFLGLRGMRPFEFPLDPQAERIKSFFSACSAKR
jgi:hypothetical protein